MAFYFSRRIPFPALAGAGLLRIASRVFMAARVFSRRQVAITLGHLQRAMPHELAHRVKVNAGLNEPRCESMPQRVKYGPVAPVLAPGVESQGVNGACTVRGASRLRAPPGPV